VSRIKIIAAVLGVIASVAALSVPAALATQLQECANGGTGYCLQAHNGATGNGTPVVMWYGGSTAEDFFTVADYICDGTQFVLSTYYGDPVNCPFGTVSADNYYHGDRIVIDEYGSFSHCVATTTSGYAELWGCNGNGTVMIKSGCSGGNYLIDRYWTDIEGTSFGLTSTGKGGQADFTSGFGSCWGGT
jgi:hypothetical protein